MLAFGQLDRRHGPDDQRTALQRMLDRDVRRQVKCEDGIYRAVNVKPSSGSIVATIGPERKRRPPERDDLGVMTDATLAKHRERIDAAMARLPE